MAILTLTPTADSPTVAPTQGLRDLIDLLDSGMCSVEDVHNELLRLESALELPMTEVSPYNGLDEGSVEVMKAEELEEALKAVWVSGGSLEMRDAWQAQREYARGLREVQNETAGA
ncbi:hypothetical protein [Pseudarthrobacter sp. PS3-L1]|uniref:hypothetical protein n=1 Tax=Pseudarthrobacter sp. PS3-L1 TaxID=3046207 RepID=UPI0024BB1610|nr:hypothetical protein [Pseudarthrobacter sp. PS3-L1]MDJ0319789.1 hypothetical protein [Pseudarthrobacter sp. PS3-L1]